MSSGQCKISSAANVVCFSHLRWAFVYQRPQHLLRRASEVATVHFWEEPLHEECDEPRLKRSLESDGVRVLTPMLPMSVVGDAALLAERKLLDAYVAEEKLSGYVAWYYTPMALRISDHLRPTVTVYDCMDELSAFQGAPPELIDHERQLFERADVVFAGGASLFAVKKTQHGNVHLYPSSIDHEHFAAARKPQPDPLDQEKIARPRIGFYGVLDERLDCELLQEVAASRPEWNFVLLGPVVKIKREDLPSSSNIHYLGQKSYAELPAYLAGWNVAMLPFARNAATRFISPTKTPEYLAAGKPVVSTAIQDVVRPYGESGLVYIAEDASEFAKAIEACLQQSSHETLDKVDRFLAGNSWDKTFGGMWKEIQRCMSPLDARDSADDRAAQERSGANV